MRYPDGHCRACGERLHAHVDGGFQCLNCAQRYPDDEFDGGSGRGGDRKDDRERPTLRADAVG